MSTKLESDETSSLKTSSRSHKKEVPIRVIQPTISQPSKSQSVSTNEFKCQHCSESFEFKSMLIIHELSHKREVWCDVCHKKVYKESYDEHIETHFVVESFTCDYCGLQFVEKCLIEKHVRAHVMTKFECEECGKEFYSVTNLNNHKSIHNKPVKYAPWKCDLCPQKYPSKKLLELHMIHRHQTEVKLKCNIQPCGYTTTNYRNLATHRFSHFKEFKCEPCNVGFTSLASYEIHCKSKKHAKLTQCGGFQCRLCSLILDSLYEIKEHVRGVHGVSKNVTRFYQQKALNKRRIQDKEVKAEVKIVAKSEKCEEKNSNKSSITIPLAKPPKPDPNPSLDPSTSVKITTKVPSPTPQPQDVKTEVLFEIKLNHGKAPTIIPSSNAKEIPKMLEGSSNVKVFSVETALKLLSKESKIRIKSEVDQNVNNEQNFENDHKIEVKVEPQDVEQNLRPEELYNVIKEEPQEIVDYQITPYVPDEQRKRISFPKSRRKAPASIYPTQNYPFCCSICGLSFEHQSILLMHKMTHQKDFVEVFQCDLCSKSFKDKFSLEMHINITHRQKRTYECNLCEFSTGNIKTFRNHKLKHLKNSAQCNICDKNFRSQQKLTQHVTKYHQNDKSVPCGVCGKLFKSTNYVMRHIKTTHAGDLKFQCVYCHKSFATRGELNQHVGSLWRIGKCKTHVKSE